LLDKFVPDILLADYSVPGYNGLAAMADARKRIPTVPVVIVSGSIGEEFAIECLKAGANDYVLKDKLTKLVLVIKRALKEAEQLLEKNRAEEAQTQLTEELKRSNKDLEQFARVASHDLREPLRAITGFMELLCQRSGNKLDEKDMEYINYAIGGAKRMNDLITCLLQYSHIETNGKAFSPIPVRGALMEALTNLRKTIEETGAVVTYDELPEIKADGPQIIQLFQNLIANAIKFRSEQSERRPEVHVGCQKLDNCWQFSLKDNGIGIDPQFNERIFLVFQRLHAQGKYPGYGVGLSICKKIVERHKGRIWVESEKGKGATFYFTIPL